MSPAGVGGEEAVLPCSLEGERPSFESYFVALASGTFSRPSIALPKASPAA